MPERLRAVMGNRIARGASGTFALKVAEAGATFLLNIVLARWLGAAGLGVFAFAMAWANLLVIPGLAGRENLSVRHVAGYSAASAWSSLRGYLRDSALTVAGVATLLALVGAAVAYLLQGGVVTDRLVVLWLAMALVPTMALVRLVQAFMRGLRHIVLGFLPELAVLPIVTFAGLGLLFLLQLDLTPGIAMGLHVAAGLVALAIGVVALRRRLPPETASAAPAYDRGAWWASAIPLLFIGGTQVVNRQADIIMLGVFVGDAAAGIYSVATRTAGLVGFVLFAANAAMAPQITRVHASGDFARLQQLATRSARMVLVFSVPTAGAFIFFGQWFLLLFGREFTDGAVPLAILAIGQFVNASMGSVALLLTMTGHERLAARGFAAGAFSNVTLNLILIPPFGMVGAAIATSISLVVWNLVLAYYVLSRLGIHSSALGVLRWPPGDRIAKT